MVNSSRSRNLLEFYNFIGFVMILEKMQVLFAKIEARFLD